MSLFKCGNKWRLVWLIILCNTAHTTHTAQWALIFNVQVFNIYRISVSYKKKTANTNSYYYNVRNKESTVTNKYDYFMCFSINIWYSVFIGAHKRYYYTKNARRLRVHKSSNGFENVWNSFKKKNYTIECWLR